MFTPECRPLLIGSLPVSDHQQATDIILSYTPEIPLWPQLPKLPREGMVRQFLSGFPGLVDEGKRFWVDTANDDFATEMASFYEEYIAVETNPEFLPNSRFRLDNDSAAGFNTFTETLKLKGHSSYTLKGQITGPITTGTGTITSEGKSIFYDDNLRDILIKHLTMKACWQVRELKKFTGNMAPIIFIDEPAMVSFGSSAFVGITKEMVTHAMTEVITGIKAFNALAGVHICANGDWEPVLQSRADIISFDAYSYFDNLFLFKTELMDFLKNGGILAWGIVPTGNPELVAKESTASLLDKFEVQLKQLTTLGFSTETILERVLITPSCGTGSLSVDNALKVLDMTRELSQNIKDKYFS